MKVANLALAFALEIAALLAIAAWGRWYGSSQVLGWLCAAGAVTAWASVWGTLFAPKARIQLPVPWLVIGQCLMFAVAAFGLVATGRWQLASSFAALVIVNRLLFFVSGARRPGCLDQ